MEQQSQARERQREQPQDRRAEENRRTPERERLSDAGLAARAVLAGESLLDLPPSRLEELAGWVGAPGGTGGGDLLPHARGGAGDRTLPGAGEPRPSAGCPPGADGTGEPGTGL